MTSETKPVDVARLDGPSASLYIRLLSGLTTEKLEADRAAIHALRGRRGVSKYALDVLRAVDEELARRKLVL